MKKRTVIALLLIGLLTLSACKNSPETYQGLDPDAYVTLSEYKGLSYTPADTAVSDYEYQVALNKKIADGGYVTHPNEKIEEGTVQVGDKTNIDYSGTKDGVKFDGGTAQSQLLTIGSGKFIAGFEEGLVGVKIGDTVDLNLTFPENYGNEELAGAAVVFTVKVNYVADRPSYAELTDELAAKLDKTTPTAAEFTAKVRKELEDKKLASAETQKKNDLWGAVIEGAKFKDPLPQKLVDQSFNEFKAYYEADAKQKGYDSLEAYLSANNYSMKQFEEVALKNAEAIVKSQLAAYAVAKAEGKAFTDEEVRAFAEKGASDAGYTDVEKYIERAGMDAIRDQAVLNWAVDLVVEAAKAE